MQQWSMTKTFIAHLEIAIGTKIFSNNDNHLDTHFLAHFLSIARFSQAVHMHQAWPILDCSRDGKADGERKRERARQRGMEIKSQ